MLSLDRERARGNFANVRTRLQWPHAIKPSLESLHFDHARRMKVDSVEEWRNLKLWKTKSTC